MRIIRLHYSLVEKDDLSSLRDNLNHLQDTAVPNIEYISQILEYWTRHNCSIIMVPASFHLTNKNLARKLFGRFFSLKITKDKL